MGSARQWVGRFLYSGKESLYPLMQFDDFGLLEPLLRAVRFEGYTHPTPIQEQAIPHVMKGKDLLGCAQTGTGKTAAFALPILHRLSAARPAGAGKVIRSLILTPTRELAAQIAESFHAYGRHSGLHHAVVYGGVPQGPQERSLRKGVDILVATPGRLLDLMGQRLVDLRHVLIFVLDEADRMLDMGFIDDVRRIISALPARRQTLLFSATMPREIQSLADSVLDEPVEVRVTPETPAAETVSQLVYFVERQHKQALLEHLLGDAQVRRALIFTRTKRGADRVARRLKEAHIRAEAIHSDKTQGARERILEDFKGGRTRVLVASDIASRGLDVDDISHVVNFDLPEEPETYVHRIGRTGRAGAAGQALSFCGIEERIHLDGIEKLLHRTVPHVPDHPFLSPLPRALKSASAPAPSHSWRRPTHRNLLTGRRRRGR